MKLTQLYQSILLAAGLVADEEGYVYVHNKLFTGEDNAPAMIGEQRIVLPTDEQMRHPSKEKIIFHPLREQAMRGESVTFSKLRVALTTRLNFTFATLIGAMIDVVKRVEIHKCLSPSQSHLLSVGKNISEKTHEIFSEVCLRTMGEENMSFVSMFMKKSGTVDNQPYRRVAVVSFPIYEELCKEQDKYFGMTIKPTERENLKALMQYLLPGIDKPSNYNRGSNSDVAPYMGALMNAFGEIASHFNDNIDLFDKFIAEHEILKINDEWVDIFEDLDAHRTLIHMVPQQAGNEGASPVQAPQPQMQPVPQSTHATQHTTPTTAQPYQPQQPATAQQQAPATTGKPMSFNDMVASAPHLQQYRQTQVYGGGGAQYTPSPSAPRGQWFTPPAIPGYGGYPMGAPQPGYAPMGYPPPTRGPTSFV